MSRRHAMTLASRRRAAAETHSEISLLVCGLIVSIRRSSILLSACSSHKAGGKARRTAIHSPPPSYAGLSGESLSILEGQLVGRIWRGGPGGVGSVWLVDVSDGSSGEQASADEFGEADGGHLEEAVSGGDAQQEVGNHGGQQLQSDGVGVATEEGRDLEMLLDPSEQQLDLPAPLVEAADLDGGALEVVGEEGDLGSVVALETNAAHRDGELGVTFADQLDLGIVEDGEATALGLADGPPALGAKARALLHAGHEAGAGPIDAGPPVVAAIALVVDVGAAGGVRHRPADC